MTSFVDVVDSAARRSATTPRARPDLFHASSIGGCERRAVLVRAGVKGEPFDVRTLRKLWVGTVIHEALQSAVRRIIEDNPAFYFFTLPLDHLTILSEDYHVTGEMDQIIGTPDGIMVFEYKSWNEDAMEWGSLPKQEHVLQLAVYLAFAKPPVPAAGCLVYVGKDSGDVREFLVPRTTELIEGVKAKLRTLESEYQTYLKVGTLPDRLPQVERKSRKKKPDDEAPVMEVSQTCLRCPYLNDCWNKDEIAIGKRSPRTESQVSPE